MLNFIWPILLIVGSNVFYQVAAKSTPGNLNPFIAVFINYVVGAVFAVLLFFLSSKEASFTSELTKSNWAPYVLGLSIVGLEVGSVYMYRVGWNISIGSTVANIALAVIIMIVGVLFYKEAISMKQVVGMVICVAGLVLINWK